MPPGEGPFPAAALGLAANEAAHERTIEMLRIIVTTPDLRARMRARVEAVITDNTRVIVAHSIGTLLAYAALCKNPHWSAEQVDRLREVAATLLSDLPEFQRLVRDMGRNIPSQP